MVVPYPQLPARAGGYGCSTTSNLRWHFAYRHPYDKVAIRGTTFLKCPLCGLQVSPIVLRTFKHEAFKNCRRMAAMHHQHAIANNGARVLERKFTAYGIELRRVDWSKYLGHPLAYDDCTSCAIHLNLSWVQGVWGCISKVIVKDFVTPPIAGMFYQAVMASILLYGSKTWVTPPRDMKAPESFHVECCRRITGIRPKKRGETWNYPKSAAVLKAVVAKTIEHYIRRRRRTIHTTVTDRPILEACRRMDR